MTRRLGVAWHQPEHGIAEITGIDPAVLSEFSQRTRDVERRVDHKLQRFRQRLGRDPTAKERWRLEREAAVDSRPAKPQGLTPADLRREWQQRTVALGHDPDLVVRQAIGRSRGLDHIDDRVTGTLIDTALASLADRQSSWRPAEPVRELAAAVPTTMAVDAAELTAALDELGCQVAASRGVYTPMTRGRDANHAYVVAEDKQTARDVLTRAIARDWIDQPALSRQAQVDPHRSPHLAPTAPGGEEELAELERRFRQRIAEPRAQTRNTQRTPLRGVWR